MANINDILKAVPVKNRVVDAQVMIQHDSQSVVWEPGETRYLPNRYYAEWFRAKSLYKLDDRTYQHKYRLVILNTGQDESDLHAADLPSKEDSIIDWESRQYVDPKTQKPFRRVAVPTNGVPVMEPRRDAADAEVAAKLVALGAKMEAGVDKLTSFSDEEIAAGLRELGVKDDAQAGA